MTASHATRPRTDARYLGAVYGIDVLDHHTGKVVENDYVGKTRQRGRARENQHRDTQPFSDRIVGSSRVLWEGLCTEAELDEMERHFIQDMPCRPRLNYVLNEDNPERIPKWVQVEQRHQRDDARDVPRWVPPQQRDRSSLLDWDVPARQAAGPRPNTRKPSKWWRPWQRQTLGACIAWLGVFVTGWILLAHYRLVGGWQDQALTAVLVPVPLIGWTWRWTALEFPMSQREWQRQARKARGKRR